MRTLRRLRLITVGCLVSPFYAAFGVVASREGFRLVSARPVAFRGALLLLGRRWLLSLRLLERVDDRLRPGVRRTRRRPRDERVYAYRADGLPDLFEEVASESRGWRGAKRWERLGRGAGKLAKGRRPRRLLTSCAGKEKVLGGANALTCELERPHLVTGVTL
jgi:hypothetical protein